MTIYFLSGLGADKKVFQYLNLSNSLKLIYLDWLEPIEKESLNHYAKRISMLIDSTQPFILIGLSFGGILANEVLDYVHPYKTILISSAENRNELPFYFRLAGIFNLHKLIPSYAVNKPNPLTFWLFGITNKKDKESLREILTSSNTKFSKWAVDQILNWKRVKSTKEVIRIHGNKDRILPINNFIPKYLINDAGHFMIVNRANEISGILNAEIDNN